jgi:hypothetical protein
MSANVRGGGFGAVRSNAPREGDWSAWGNAWIELSNAVNFLLRGGGARTSLNTSVGDANYSILPFDEIIETSTAFSAARTGTLPSANSVDAGYEISIIDAVPAITSTNTLTIARSGSDTIDGSASSLVLDVPKATVTLVSDGLSRWGIKDELGSISTPVTVGSPTGGSKGAGTVNVATGYYVNGSKGATYQATPADPTGTNSISGAMMGLAGSITPRTTGTIVILISGVGTVDTAGDTYLVQGRYGTGAAPANGVALSGTGFSSQVGATIPTLFGSDSFCCQGLVTGTVNTPYWIDLALANGGGTGNKSVLRLSVTAFELTL